MLLSNIRRLAHISLVVCRHGLSHLWGRLATRLRVLSRRLPTAQLSGPERLRAVLEDLGGSFVKFGQMLALQPDILPFAYCNALFDLLDRIAPFEFDQVKRTFLEDFGKEPAELFDSLEREPLATASVGQVHVAYLKGEKVAVKVRRPRVEIDFAGDIRLMAGAIRWIRRLRLKPFYWMVEPMGEFVSWTREELDFRNEARYMAQLAENSRNSETERVPKVYWDLTSSRIMVAEYFEGVTVLGYLRAREAGDEVTLRRMGSLGLDHKKFAQNIIDNFLGDAFQYGIFHADLHPANLMIMPGNVVGYVDFGITGVLSHFSRRNLVELTLAYTRGDLDGMCRSFVQGATMDERSDLARFRQGLEEHSKQWYEREGGECRLRKNFTLVMLDMLLLSRKTSIWPERDVIKYIRSSIAIDGLITRFAPDFNVGMYLAQVCDRHLSWEVRRSLLSYDKLLDWSIPGSRLMRDGLRRAGGILGQAAQGNLPIHVETEGDSGRDESLRLRAVQLGAVTLAASVLLATQGKAELGINLFTAEMALAACAGLLALRTVLRLA